MADKQNSHQRLWKTKEQIIIKEHVLVPKHTLLSDKEKEKLLENYHLTLKELPKIKKDDPAIHSLNVKEGDVVKIERMRGILKGKHHVVYTRLQEISLKRVHQIWRLRKISPNFY